MITQAMFDFSNVELSPRRRPYYHTYKRCWYFKDASGKAYRLHTDEQRALEVWRSIVGPIPEPVVVPGVIHMPVPKPVKPPKAVKLSKALSPKPKPAPQPKLKPVAIHRPTERTRPARVDPERPQCRMQRTLTLVKLMADKRLPHSIEDIHHELEDLAGVQVCERTVRRDLELLERAGVIQRVDRNRWKSRIEFWSYRVSKVLLS